MNNLPPHQNSLPSSSHHVPPHPPLHPAHPPAFQVFRFQTPSTPIPSSSFNSTHSGFLMQPSLLQQCRFGAPAVFGSMATHPSSSTIPTTWNPPAVPLDLSCASTRQTTLAPATTNTPSQTKRKGNQALGVTTGNPSNGIFISEDDKITWYPNPQHTNPRLPQARLLPPRQIQPCTAFAMSTITKAVAFPGLCTTVAEDSFSFLLAERLAENYRKDRKAVINERGLVTTPLIFLKKLSNRVGIDLLFEETQFKTDAVAGTQHRTEILAGPFCGVAHALSPGLSKQLAAAHCLERMRIHFPKLKKFSYALFPGSLYKRIGSKLDDLCFDQNLGMVQEEVRNRRRNRARGVFDELHEGHARGRDLEEKWECSCLVKDFLEEIVVSDNRVYGTYEAKAKMYLKIAKELDVPVAQIKDYFAVGVDCPMFRDIHPSVMLHLPSVQKCEWMKEYEVPQTRMDLILHDPTNQSTYLQKRSLQNKLITFGRKLNEALEEILVERSGRYVGNREFRRNRSGVMGGPRNGASDFIFMEIGNMNMDNHMEMDEADREVEEIFYDAMEM